MTLIKSWPRFKKKKRFKILPLIQPFPYIHTLMAVSKHAGWSPDQGHLDIWQPTLKLVGDSHDRLSHRKTTVHRGLSLRLSDCLITLLEWKEICFILPFRSLLDNWIKIDYFLLEDSWQPRDTFRCRIIWTWNQNSFYSYIVCHSFLGLCASFPWRCAFSMVCSVLESWHTVATCQPNRNMCFLSLSYSSRQHIDNMSWELKVTTQ